jgi:hypothetical protein
MCRTNLHSDNTPSWRGAQFKHRENFALSPVMHIKTIDAVHNTEVDIHIPESLISQLGFSALTPATVIICQ